VRISRFRGEPEFEKVGFEDADAEWHVAGFAASNTTWYDGSTGRQFVVPFWFIAALTALIISAALGLRPKKHRRGLCSSCGYDLRATPHRCPECGAVPARKAAT